MAEEKVVWLKPLTEGKTKKDKSYERLRGETFSKLGITCSELPLDDLRCLLRVATGCELMNQLPFKTK